MAKSSENHILVPSHFFTFCQYCSIGFSSGEYAKSLTSFTLFSFTNLNMDFVKCQLALSTIMHILVLFLCSLLINARNFLLLILFVIFVTILSLNIAPKTQNFWCGLFRIFFVGFEPTINHPLVM